MYKKILVPLDGSKIAEGVLPHATHLAQSEGAQIVLLHVAPNPSQAFAFADPYIAQRAIESEEALAREYLPGIETRLRTDGLKVSIEFRSGSPGEAILRAVDELGAGLIAMSTHGRTGPSRWLLGSVAERVVRYSKVPVLLVRARE